MTRMRSFTLVASIALMMQVACTGNSTSPASGDTATPSPARNQKATRVVAVALPVANQIVVVDPVEAKAWNLASVPPPKVNALHGIADLEGTLAVVGTGNDRIALLDEETGELIRSAPLAPRKNNVSLEAGWYVVERDGHLFATADAFRGVGYLFKLDSTTLRYQDSVKIGFGQNGIAFDQQGRLWTLGVEGSKGSSATTVSIVDVEAMKAHTLPLRGYPAGIAPGPGKKMYVALREKGEVVAVSQQGTVVDNLHVGGHPWGIDIRQDGLGVVVADNADIDQSRSAYIVDFDNLKVQSEVHLEGCPDAREVVVVHDRAVVVCAGLPGVLILDLEKVEIVGILSFPDPREIEQPRTPVVIKLQ